MGFGGYTPHQLDQALQYLHQFGDETTILAGGTDLLVRHYGKLFELKRVLNICELDELKCIKTIDEEIEVGSMVTHAQLENSTIVQHHVPLLAEAAATVGSPQIRNRGTIGGNVANSSPAGDLLPVLLVLEAKVKMVSLDRGERRVSVMEFFTGPGRNLLKADELITGFVFTKPSDRYRGSFQKLGYRKALAIATVNTAVLLEMEGNLVKDSRIALGAVAPTPIRAHLTEELMNGKQLTDLTLEAALDQLTQEILPISDLRGSQQYRVDTARALTDRAIRTILHQGGKRK